MKITNKREVKGEVLMELDGYDEDFREVFIPIYKCPICNNKERYAFKVCPDCGVVITKWE